MTRFFAVVFGLGISACGFGSGGGPTGGNEFHAALRCPVCGVGTYAINVGQLATFLVEARDFSTGQDVTCPQSTWTSSSPGVATVVGAAQTGTVTAVGVGSATITVELDCGSYGIVTVAANILVVEGQNGA